MAVQTSNATEILHHLRGKFGADAITTQETMDEVPTFWTPRSKVTDILRHLKSEVLGPYPMLYDLLGIDERLHKSRDGLPPCDFSVVYHLLSFERNQDIRIKVPLQGEYPSTPTVTHIWPNANWYEREVWDMFGIVFDGHPNLRRILMPTTWKGHPLRKEHPARATEVERFQLTDERQDTEQEALQFKPEEWGMERESEDSEFMFLNIGPHHPGTHGVLRIALQLDGEEIVDAVADIGYHHRGAEKMGERQTWHTYIP